MKRPFRSTCVAVASTLAAVASASATSWIEVGDAGQLPITAQVTTGTGSLLDICGKLINKNDVDIFCIRIENVAQFEATASAPFDTQLFLFTLTGQALSMGDQNAPGNQGRITSQFVPAVGDYLIAISRYNNDPVDAVNALIWNNTPRNTERAPDGPSTLDVLANWNNGGNGSGGDYKIDFKGTTFCPTPGTASALVLGGLLLNRRRRRA